MTEHPHVYSCCKKVDELESQLSQVQKEVKNANRGAETNMHMTKLALEEKAAMQAERDALKAENEKLTALINKEHHFKLSLLDKQLSLQKEVQRYKMALEYIELTGGNVGHVAITGVPHDCHCGGCMATEASKALASQGDSK